MVKRFEDYCTNENICLICKKIIPNDDWKWFCLSIDGVNCCQDCICDKCLRKKIKIE